MIDKHLQAPCRERRINYFITERNFFSFSRIVIYGNALSGRDSAGQRCYVKINLFHFFFFFVKEAFEFVTLLLLLPVRYT